MKRVKRILILDTIYKTQYTTPDMTHLNVQFGHYPLRSYHSGSAHSELFDQFLQFNQALVSPAGVLNIITGFAAAVLIHCEYNGIPCLLLTAVIDSHYVTEETIGAFEVVARELLGKSDFQKDKISHMTGFKGAIKEANTKEYMMFT